MDAPVLITLYSLAVVASSLFGGYLPSLVQLTHVRMQISLSFVGGVMLGIGVLHMLPHAYIELDQNLDLTLYWMLAGLLGMFFLIRTFHFHEHGVASPEEGEGACGQEHPHDHDHAQGQHTDRPQGQAHTHAGHSHAHDEPAMSSIGWLGVACGLSLHAFLDGVALGAGVISEMAHGVPMKFAGFGIFIAILLHKPLDALSITTLMQARRWTWRSQQIVNAGFALMCPLGAWFVFFWIQSNESAGRPAALGIALAISAGVFLCISLSDLLPEVQFHRHDRFKLSAALLLGVLCAYTIRFLEPAHSHGSHEGHGHTHGTQREVQPDGDSGPAFDLTP